MKIVQVVAYYPPHLGGMERFVKNLAELLTLLNRQVTVLTSDQGTNGAHAEQWDNLEICYLRSVEIAHTPIIPGLIFALLRQPTDSVFHVHVSQALLPELAMLAAWLKKIPFIAHVHLDVDASGPFGVLLAPYKRIFLRHVLYHARTVICLTDEQKEQMIARYRLRAERVVVVPNAVADQFFMEQHFSKPEMRLLYVGRLSHQKRVDFLLRALTHIEHSVFLDIVGDGELRPELETLCQRLGLHNVVFHGMLSGDALLERYKQATVAVTSSRKEGLSLSLLEAMAAGVPIIATEGPGISNLVQGYGIVTPADEVRFANAVDELLDAPDQWTVISHRQQVLAREYTWSQLVQHILTIYESR